MANSRICDAGTTLTFLTSRSWNEKKDLSKKYFWS